jgi:hypothetical protein
MNRKENKAKLNVESLEKATETALLWLFERNDFKISITLKATTNEEIIALYKKFVSLDNYLVTIGVHDDYVHVAFYKEHNSPNVSEIFKHPHVSFDFSKEYNDFILKSIDDMWLTEKEIVKTKEKFINDLKRYEK